MGIQASDIRDFICDSYNTGLGRFENGKDCLSDFRLPDMVTDFSGVSRMDRSVKSVV